MTDTRDGRDIVERLRHAPVVFGTEMFGATRLLEDAASEIERLRSQRVAVPEGWRLVPLAPTDVMIHAGRCETAKINNDDDYAQAKACWSAMLAASPQSPTYTLSSERARVIEECAAIADEHHDTERDPYSKASAAHIAIAIRARAHGDSNDR